MKTKVFLDDFECPTPQDPPTLQKQTQSSAPDTSQKDARRFNNYLTLGYGPERPRPLEHLKMYLPGTGFVHARCRKRSHYRRPTAMDHSSGKPRNLKEHLLQAPLFLHLQDERHITFSRSSFHSERPPGTAKTPCPNPPRAITPLRSNPPELGRSAPLLPRCTERYRHQRSRDSSSY